LSCSTSCSLFVLNFFLFEEIFKIKKRYKQSATKVLLAFVSYYCWIYLAQTNMLISHVFQKLDFFGLRLETLMFHSSKSSKSLPRQENRNRNFQWKILGWQHKMSMSCGIFLQFFKCKILMSGKFVSFIATIHCV
jgi:hypothetical protein